MTTWVMDGPQQLRMTGRRTDEDDVRLVSVSPLSRAPDTPYQHQPAAHRAPTITFHKGEEFELIETLFKIQL